MQINILSQNKKEQKEHCPKVLTYYNPYHKTVRVDVLENVPKKGNKISKRNKKKEQILNCVCVMPNDVRNIIITYVYQLIFSESMQEAKQRFHHDRLMKEIFHNRTVIQERFFYTIGKELDKYFLTRGEEDVNFFGYGDDKYMEDYFMRFQNNYNYY